MHVPRLPRWRGSALVETYGPKRALFNGLVRSADKSHADRVFEPLASASEPLPQVLIDRSAAAFHQISAGRNRESRADLPATPAARPTVGWA